MGSKKRSADTGRRQPGAGPVSVEEEGEEKALPGEPQSEKVDSLICVWGWGAAIFGEINALLSGSP